MAFEVTNVGAQIRFNGSACTNHELVIFVFGRILNSKPNLKRCNNLDQCFNFVSIILQCSAMVVESRDLWFADDNGLTKELCADPQENEDEQPEINEPCCACDEAKYEVQYIIFFLLRSL